MPRFKKMILPVGEYMVNRADGKRVIKNFPETYLKEVADNFSKMKEAGLRVPVPFKHLKEAVPVTEAVNDDSYDNAGYWDEVKMGTDDETGDYGLIGIVDAPGSEDDMNSPAGKLKHRVKEVSACIKDSWEDGLGRKWGPSMLHGAAVTNPIVPGQSEFSLVDDAYALSMTGIVQETDNADMNELATALRESVGVYIPDSITQPELVKVLLVSLRQLKLTNKDQENGDNEVVNSVPVFMSLSEGTPMPLSKAAAEELIALGGINPKTNKPFTMSDFTIVSEEEKPSVDEAAFLSMQTFAKAATQQLQDERKANLHNRINNLVATGRVSKEYADTNLVSALDTYQLSIGENAQFEKSPLESTLEALEKLEAKTPEKGTQELLLSSGIPSGYDIHKPTEGGEAEISKEDSEEMLKDMLSRC